MNNLKATRNLINSNCNSFVNIVQSGSSGNAVIYNEMILVDAGVPYKNLKIYLPKIKLILLTHIHSDHFKKSTIKNIHTNFPHIKFVCEKYLYSELVELVNAKNIIVSKIGENLRFKGGIEVRTVKLYHDVLNVGYRLKLGQIKVFHATDTAHLNGINAENYDFYCLEHNYCEEKATKILQSDNVEDIQKILVLNSMNTHLSIQQAKKWLKENNKNFGLVYELHKSKTRR